MDHVSAVIALDTNILVYAHRQGAPEYSKAWIAIERASQDQRGWGVPLQVITEFWAISTNPSRPDASRPSEAADFINSLINETEMKVWFPLEGFSERLIELATQMGRRGVAIYDLQIALIAIDAGASELWTHDRNFVRLPELRVHDPL